MKEVIFASPEVLALDLILPMGGKKRILSPGELTPIGRIRKQVTRNDNSPILKGREIDWESHLYEYMEVEDDDRSRKDTLPADHGRSRSMAVPRRRIITFEEGAETNKDIKAKAPKEKKKERGEGEHMGADTGGNPVKGKT